MGRIALSSTQTGKKGQQYSRCALQHVNCYGTFKAGMRSDLGVIAEGLCCFPVRTCVQRSLAMVATLMRKLTSSGL
jgi:hypothetical protein